MAMNKWQIRQPYALFPDTFIVLVENKLMYAELADAKPLSGEAQAEWLGKSN